MSSPTPSARTDVVEAVREWMRQGDYREALALIDRREAELDTDADYLRGEIYSSAEKEFHGIGRDSRKALRFYRRAADAGHADAAYEVGGMLERGEGAREDLEAAIKYLRQASDQGHEMATWEMANLLYDHPERPDAGAAIGLFERLSGDEHLGGGALLKLGRIYARGLCGVAPDPARALRFLEAAAERQNENALMDLALLYLRGKGVERDLERARAYAHRAPGHLLYDEIVEALNAAEDNGGTH